MEAEPPTALPAEDIDAILTKLDQLFDTENALEFTVEAGRPDSITEEKLRVLRPWHHQDFHKSPDYEPEDSGSDRPPPYGGDGKGKVPHGKRAGL